MLAEAPKTCRVSGCPMAAVGEAVLWREGRRDPIVASVCTVHWDLAAVLLAELVEGTYAAKVSAP